MAENQTVYMRLLQEKNKKVYTSKALYYYCDINEIFSLSDNKPSYYSGVIIASLMLQRYQIIN